MPELPRVSAFDSTLQLLSDPYRFVTSRCEQLGTDVFEARVMLRRAVFAYGAEAARVFYETDRFTRRGAVPLTALLLLQDRGSAATLDGDAHRHRKAMLMSLMSPERVLALGDALATTWRRYLGRWRRRETVVLARDLPEVLTRAVCGWAGVPLTGVEVRRRTAEFRAMYEGAGAVGPRNWRGLALRARNERWARRLVTRVRDRDWYAPPGSALRVIAEHRELDGRLTPLRHAAVELINILRPTVAVERFITFAALALHEHPRARERLSERDDPMYREWFVQEVRRFYPFVPMVGGRARVAFDWRGHRFAPGTWMMLDLYGTNHDARIWQAPETFSPERFKSRDPGAFELIPQGGGDHYTSHRCAGEWITIELMKRAVEMLTQGMTYKVPKQNLRIDMRRMPAIPRSGFVISVSR